MAFLPVQYDDGQLQYVECATSQTIVKGDALKPNATPAGYLEVAAAGDNEAPEYVAMQTVTTTADGQKVLAIRTRGVFFEADCDAAPAITVQHERIDLASKSTLDADAVTDQIFYVEEIIGTVGTSTKVRGRFAHDTLQS